MGSFQVNDNEFFGSRYANKMGIEDIYKILQMEPKIKYIVCTKTKKKKEKFKTGIFQIKMPMKNR